MRTYIQLLVVAFTIAAGAPAARADLAAAMAALERQDWAEAHHELTRLAEAGDPKAQWQLALLYFDGQGVAEDTATALRWTRAAAEGGEVEAQDHMGFVNEFGFLYGIERDTARAAEWYRRAAEQDYALSQRRLALLYHLGDGVPKDEAQARHWYDRALAGFRRGAAEGDPVSQFELAEMYELGEAVPIRLGLSAMLYRAAAGAGFDMAQLKLAKMYHAQYSASKVVGAVAPPGALPEDPVEAYKWYALAARRGIQRAIDSRDWAAERLTPQQRAEADRWLADWQPRRTRVDDR